jgi:hypothetical protein
MSLSFLMENGEDGSDGEDGEDGSNGEGGSDNESLFTNTMLDSQKATTNRASPAIVSKRKRALSVRTIVFAVHSPVVTFYMAENFANPVSASPSTLHCKIASSKSLSRRQIC